MSENADFVAAVFYYKDNNVKQVFYSDDIKDLLPGETKNIEIPVADNLTSFKIKTQLWNLSGEIPSPISGEIFADSTENADL